MLDILVRPDMNAHGREKIFIGRQGENLARRVKFDISEWRNLYGEGEAQLICHRPGDKYPYSCTLTSSDDNRYVYWGVTKVDVGVPGIGEMQLRYYVDGALAKSEIWATKIDESLTSLLGPTPDAVSDWIGQIAKAAQEEVDKHLPTASVAKVNGGHEVTLTDVEHSESFTVMDGEDGYSPEIELVGVPNGTKVNVSTKTGSKSFVVYDGDDGYSPEISVSEIEGGHRISITDASGTKTIDVMDGAMSNYTYGIEDLTAGTDSLETGHLYFMYE